MYAALTFAPNPLPDAAMQSSDFAPIIALSMMAARADGRIDPEERAAIDGVVSRIGSPDVSLLEQQVAKGNIKIADLARRLSGDDAKQLAYQGALAVINADGSTTPAERGFLEELRSALGLTDDSAAHVERAVLSLGSDGPAAPASASPAPSSAPGGGMAAGAAGMGAAGAAAGLGAAGMGAGVASPPGTPHGTIGTGDPENIEDSGQVSMDDMILNRAILTGAIEIMPDNIANMIILPLQMQLIYQIGKRHGQQMDASQVKDLIAVLGLGAAAQALESVAMKAVGGIGGALLGSIFGGTTRVATGGAITFTATYALGHVADTYYAQGRRIGKDDLKTLYAQFMKDAHKIFPRVQSQLSMMSRRLNLGRVASMVQQQQRLHHT